MPDESWKGSGTCTVQPSRRLETRYTTPGRRARTSRTYPYKITGGTGKYEGASGGGTCTIRQLDGHPCRRQIQGHDTIALSGVDITLCAPAACPARLPFATA